MKIKACKSAGLRLCRSPIRRPSRIGRFYVGVLSLISNLQRVITDDDLPKEEEAAPVLAIGHGEAEKPKEMSEADLLRAMQSDRPIFQLELKSPIAPAKKASLKKNRRR